MLKVPFSRHMKWCWLSMVCTNKQPTVLAPAVGHTCGMLSAELSGMQPFAISRYMFCNLTVYRH